MRVTPKLTRAALLAASLLASLSYAQGTSVVTGTVTDAATGKPVPDVVVTARSSALQGEQIVVTDISGQYRMAQLPPGTFELSLEKESYKPFKRSEIMVRVDRTIRVNIQLQPESVQGETVVVVGRPPTVDVGSTQTGLSVGKDFINNVAFLQPNANGVRSFESLAAVAPQAVEDDVGYGISGGTSPENLYLVDGVSVGDPAYGRNGAQFPVDFVEEANVVTGGYLAEYGRATGGVLNVLTKSGSNEFHGSVFGNLTPGTLSGNPKEIPNFSTSFVSKSKLWNVGDFGVEVGGPILTDKLWFYAGYSPSFSRYQNTLSLRRFNLNEGKTDFLYDADGNIQTSPIAGATRANFADTQTHSYIAKLTYLVNADHHLSLSVIGSPTRDATPNLMPGQLSGSILTDNTNTVSAKYNGSFLDKKVLVDATVGWFHQDRSTLPDDGSALDWKAGVGSSGTPEVTIIGSKPYSVAAFMDLPADSGCEAANAVPKRSVTVAGASRYVMACPANGSGSNLNVGGIGYMRARTTDRLQTKAALTYLAQWLGHHVVKAGVDLDLTSFDDTKAYSAGNSYSWYRSYDFYLDSNYAFHPGPGDATETLRTLHIATKSTGIGTYVQDSWSLLDLVTVNLGLRYENQQLFAGDGAVGLSLNNMLSPRIGAIYDFTQQGRSKIFANYARYFESVPMDIADRSLSGKESSVYGYRNISASDSGPGCNPVKDFNQVFNECGKPNLPAGNYSGQNQYAVNPGTQIYGAGKAVIDPNLKPQSIDEIVAGGEYEVISGGRLGATYTKRSFNYVIEDMSTDGAATFFIGNPGYGMGASLPKAVRDYDAATLSFTKIFTDGWMAQLAYTWSYLRGNYNGLYKASNGQLDPNISSDFDLKSLMVNRTGPLAADHTHLIKAYVSKEFEITSTVALVAGLSYFGMSGAPLNYLGASVNPLYGENETYILASGSAGRLPWQHEFDAKVGVSYKISKEHTITVTADVFNLLNLQGVTAVDETFTSERVLPLAVPAGQSPQAAACIGGAQSANPACAELAKNGTLPVLTSELANLKESDVNPNFKRPTAYQAPISVRFGAKFTF